MNFELVGIKHTSAYDLMNLPLKWLYFSCFSA